MQNGANLAMFRMRKQIGYPFLALAVLWLATIACEINVGGPETPEARIPVSTEAVENLTQLWKTALEGAQESGQVTLVVNETQLTSLLAFRLQAQEDPLFQDPQVYLRDGQIQIYGTARRQNFRASVRVVLTVEVDEQGLPDLLLESADFGPLPVPDGLLSGLSTMLDEAFTGNIGPAATGIRVEDIAIEGGLLAIVGRIR